MNASPRGSVPPRSWSSKKLACVAARRDEALWRSVRTGWLNAVPRGEQVRGQQGLGAGRVRAAHRVGAVRRARTYLCEPIHHVESPTMHLGSPARALVLAVSLSAAPLACVSPQPPRRASEVPAAAAQATPAATPAATLAATPAVGIRVEFRDGQLPPNTVEDALRAQTAALEDCRRLAAPPFEDMHSQVIFSLSISPSREVAGLQPLMRTNASEPAEACLARILRRLRFVAPEGPSAEVEVAFTLANPGSGAPPPPPVGPPRALLTPTEVFDQASDAPTLETTGPCRDNPRQSVWPFFSGEGQAREVTFRTPLGRVSLIETCPSRGARSAGSTLATRYVPDATPDLHDTVHYTEAGLTAELMGANGAQRLCDGARCNSRVAPASATAWLRTWDMNALGQRATALDRALLAARRGRRGR